LCVCVCVCVCVCLCVGVCGGVCVCVVLGVGGEGESEIEVQKIRLCKCDNDGWARRASHYAHLLPAGRDTDCFRTHVQMLRSALSCVVVIIIIVIVILSIPESVVTARTRLHTGPCIGVGGAHCICGSASYRAGSAGHCATVTTCCGQYKRFGAHGWLLAEGRFVQLDGWRHCHRNSLGRGGHRLIRFPLALGRRRPAAHGRRRSFGLGCHGRSRLGQRLRFDGRSAAAGHSRCWV